MTIRTMFDRILVESGQFIIPTESVELDIVRFRILVEAALGMLFGAAPKTITTNIKVSNLEFIFTDSFTVGGETWGIPEFVAKCVPLDVYSIGYSKFRTMQERTRYVEIGPRQKMPAPFRYRSPRLYVTATGNYDVTLAYKYKIEQIVVGEGREDYEVPDISHADDQFFKYLLGSFLVALGRSRTAFTLSDLPVQDDGVDLKSEGIQLMEEAGLAIDEEDQKWYLAWR